MFPQLITDLPKVNIHLSGLEGYLMQGEQHQIVFMDFKEDVTVSEHCHKAQFGVVLKGKIELTIDGILYTYQKGDTYFIPDGVMHSAKIYAGYADITFFDQKDRYSILDYS